MATAIHSTPKARPNSLQPLLRAYSLGYLSSVSPTIVGIVIAVLQKKYTASHASSLVLLTLRQALDYNRFPAFCGVLVGGSTLLQEPLRILLNRLRRRIGSKRGVPIFNVYRASRFLAALIAAWISFGLLNSEPKDKPYTRKRSKSINTARPIPVKDQIQQYEISTTADLSSLPVLPPEQPPDPTISPSTLLGGRTIDLSLFAVIRALDVLIPACLSPYTPPSVERIVQPAFFALACGAIMHAWFYYPSRLPPAYNTWITRASELDQRLRLALRHARCGTFVYGKETGIGPLLGSQAIELGLPFPAGNPAETIPVPCELVHCGASKNCEVHAVLRWIRAWKFAARMYFPLQGLVALKLLLPSSNSRAGSRGHVLLSAAKSAARSSAFLATFVTLFYYGVCLARTRVGPVLFPPRNIENGNKKPTQTSLHHYWPRVTAQQWDSGLDVLVGCALCGWSILLEEPRRQAEVMLFVLPRAAAVWTPRRYNRKFIHREQAIFALSAAVVAVAAQENRGRVRGVLGRVLGSVLN